MALSDRTRTLIVMLGLLLFALLLTWQQWHAKRATENVGVVDRFQAAAECQRTIRTHFNQRAAFIRLDERRSMQWPQQYEMFYQVQVHPAEGGALIDYTVRCLINRQQGTVAAFESWNVNDDQP